MIKVVCDRCGLEGAFQGGKDLRPTLAGKSKIVWEVGITPLGSDLCGDCIIEVIRDWLKNSWLLRKSSSGR